MPGALRAGGGLVNKARGAGPGEEKKRARLTKRMGPSRLLLFFSFLCVCVCTLAQIYDKIASYNCPHQVDPVRRKNGD